MISANTAPTWSAVFTLPSQLAEITTLLRCDRAQPGHRELRGR